MTIVLRKGRYAARFAETDADVTAAQRLRHLCFVTGAGREPLARGLDQDDLDDRCSHVLIEDALGQLVACFRLLPLPSGAQISQSYAARSYDLTRLQGYGGPLLEIGRFCVHPSLEDADVLRVAWGALTRFVDARGITLMFGCTSFAGTDARPYAACFDLLRSRHLAPLDWSPGIKAPQVVRFHPHLSDRRQALLEMPPLLRTYLAMGGWVSDHAVVDPAMNTLHVFTGVEIAAIPAARVRALRAVAGQTVAAAPSEELLVPPAGIFSHKRS